MDILFTEYMLPHGRTSSVVFPVPVHKETEAQTLINLGYEFSCEKLTTGDVTLYSNLPGKEDDERTSNVQLVFLSDRIYTKDEIVDKITKAFIVLIDETLANHNRKPN